MNNTAAWQDFNDAEAQNNFNLIPKGTIAPVRMTIKPGGIDDLSRGWTGGYATRAKESDSVYLNCEFVITAGEHAKRKVWSLIGLYSPKGPEWSNMGRSFIRGILNSARGLSEKDTSPRAVEARRIRGFIDLDGIEFVAKIDVEKDSNGDPKNVIKFAVTPDHKEYQGLQASAAPGASAGFQPSSAFQPAAAFQPQAAAPAANDWRPAQQQAVPAQGFQQNTAPTQSQQQVAPAQGYQQQQVAPVQSQQSGAGTFARPAWAQ